MRRSALLVLLLSCLFAACKAAPPPVAAVKDETPAPLTPWSDTAVGGIVETVVRLGFMPGTAAPAPPAATSSRSTATTRPPTAAV